MISDRTGVSKRDKGKEKPGGKKRGRADVSRTRVPNFSTKGCGRASPDRPNFLGQIFLVSGKKPAWPPSRRHLFSGNNTFLQDKKLRILWVALPMYKGWRLVLIGSLWVPFYFFSGNRCKTTCFPGRVLLKLCIIELLKPPSNTEFLLLFMDDKYIFHASVLRIWSLLKLRVFFEIICNARRRWLMILQTVCAR